MTSFKQLFNRLLGLATAVSFLVASPMVFAQDGEADAVLRSWQQHSGVQSCGRCHYQPRDEFTSVDTSISRQYELKFWLANDKHAIARRRVEPLTLNQIEAEAKELAEQYGADVGIVKGWLGPSNVLSHRICQQLGYDLNSPTGYAQFLKNCVNCHGGFRSDVETDVADFTAGQPGISCNYCHQVDQTRSWIDLHASEDQAKRQQWRTSKPTQKESVGMRDLVTTSRQASLCFDCHIGNRDQGTFVTHEMYAAGHPPLPSVELHTFCQQMPQHWRQLSEVHQALPEGLKQTYFEANFPGVFQSGETFWNTRKLLIGSLAARVKTLDLLIDSHSLNQWANYSLYDCASCHHELRRNSRRQQRGYPAAPGRPRLPEWVNLRLEPLRSFLGEDAETVLELESELATRVGEQPFGDAERVSETARELREKLTSVIKTAESQPVTAETAIKILRRLAQTPADALVTYDAARQLVWAMQVIADELESNVETLDEAVKQEIDRLSEPESAPQSTGIATELPAGRKQFIYADGLRADLNRRAAFDPDVLAERLQEIDRLLREKVIDN